MQRVVPRPSAAWLLLVALLVTSGVLTAVRGLGAFNNAAACTGYGYGAFGYGTPAPHLTLALSATEHNAGTPVTASGVFTQNGCVLPNETVNIQRRIVASGVPAGSWATIAVVSTDSNGVYTSPVYSIYNAAFHAVVLGHSGRPTTTSNTAVLITHIRLSAYAPSGARATIARICGRTLPYKGGQRIVLYRYNNGLAQWRPLQIKSVGAGSVYCFAVFLPTGRNAMLVSIPADTVNARGIKRFYDYRT
jgi:hypothetical protein